MRFREGYLTHFFVAAWACIALAAVWEICSRPTDATLAVTSGILLFTSLAVSRYILELPFTSAPLVYLGLLGLFHLGTVLPWALGIYDLARVPWFVPYGFSRALTLIAIAIITYQLGLVASLRGDRQAHVARITGSQAGLEDRRIFVVGSVLVFAGMGMFVAGLIRLDPIQYYRLTYLETWRLRAESDPRFFGTGITIALIGLSLAVAGAAKRQMRATYLYTVVWFFVLSYFGFRSPAITAILLVYAASRKKGIQWPRWVPVVAGVLLLVGVPLIRMIRNEPIEQRSLSAPFRAMNLLDGPAEVGESIRPLVETVNLVRPGNYRYGKTYLLAIERILPNLSLRWQAPVTESIDDLPPSDWITATVAPWAYRNYQGIGFSAVAEPYMNFGIGGVIVFFFCLGFLLVRLERTSIHSSYGLAVWGLILGPLLWASRNDSIQFFRPAAWGLLCLGAISLWSGRVSLMVLMTRRRVNFRIGAKATGESRP